MTDYQGEKFKKFLKLKGIPVMKAAERMGVSRNTVYQYFGSENLSRETVINIITKFNTTEQEVFGIKGSVQRLEAVPLHLASDPNDYDNDGEKYEHGDDGIIRMRVTVIPYKSQAGYFRGYQDPEYYEGFETISIDVHKQYSGHYLAFEVVGDSMTPTDPSLFEYMALPGWKAISRELPKHHWKYKLHTHNYDTWIIVHNTEGILIKSIIDQDVENGTITIHSLNPAYKDEVLHLDDIAQIFSVVKYVVDKR